MKTIVSVTVLLLLAYRNILKQLYKKKKHTHTTYNLYCVLKELFSIHVDSFVD